MTDRTADLKADAARYHAAFLKANEAATVREVAIVRLTAERERARDIAVALEGQVAAVRALADRWDAEDGDYLYDADEPVTDCVSELRAALDPDPADRGAGVCECGRALADCPHTQERP